MECVQRDVFLKNDYRPRRGRGANHLAKFWHNRACLFSAWDAGVLCDEESLYSITPEVVARHITASLPTEVRTVIDVCCGVGGNTLSYAQSGRLVIAVDNDIDKLVALTHNAAVLGQTARVVPLHCDFAALQHVEVWADFAYSAPPWGGNSYRQFRPFRPSQ